MTLPDIALPIAALAGWLLCEARSISEAIKNYESDPSEGVDGGKKRPFSFRYYFGRPRNQVLMVSNFLASLVLYLAHHEILARQQDYLGFTMPILTGGAIGFGAAWFFRWATAWARKKTEEQGTP